MSIDQSCRDIKQKLNELIQEINTLLTAIDQLSESSSEYESGSESEMYIRAPSTTPITIPDPPRLTRQNGYAIDCGRESRTPSPLPPRIAGKYKKINND